MSLITNKKKAKLSEVVFKTLQDGIMPSVLDIKKWIRKNETKYPSSSPAEFYSYFVNGNSLEPEVINEFINEYKLDMKAIYQTIEDGWKNLDDVIVKSISFSNIYDSAEVLNKSARNSLSKIDEADEFYNIKSIGNGVSSNDWDLSISEGITLDQQAGTISLSKTSTANISKEKLSVSTNNFNSEYTIETGKSFGSLDNIFDAIVSNRFIQFIHSTEVDANITMQLLIQAGDKAADNIINEIDVYTYGTQDMTCTAWTTYDGKNYTRFGDASGNGKIIILGEPSNITNIRLEITKYRNDSIIDGKPTYIFDIGEIDVFVSDYTEQGYAISNPIHNDNEVISAGIQYDGVNTDNINFYIANDVDGAQGKNDFIWHEIYDEMNWINTPSAGSDTIAIQNPTKYFYGPGAINDIWQIGETTDTIYYAEEGYNQVEVRYKNVSYANTSTVSRFDFDESIAHKYVSGLGEIRLGASVDDAYINGSAYSPNYFHIITRIYSNFATSADFAIDNHFSDGKYKIYINGSDITGSIRNNYISVPVSVGENKLEIVILVDTNQVHETSLSPRNNIRCAITKLEVSTKDAMGDSVPRICVHEENILVNRNTKNKTYRIFTLSSSSDIQSSIRIMAELDKTDGGASPSIRQVVLKTGV